MLLRLRYWIDDTLGRPRAAWSWENSTCYKALGDLIFQLKAPTLLLPVSDSVFVGQPLAPSQPPLIGESCLPRRQQQGRERAQETCSR